MEGSSKSFRDSAGLKSDVKYNNDKLKSMSKMLTYLGLVASSEYAKARSTWRSFYPTFVFCVREDVSEDYIPFLLSLSLQ